MQTPALIDDDIEALEFNNERYYPLTVNVKLGKISGN